MSLGICPGDFFPLLCGGHVHTNKRRVNKEKKADFSRTQTSKQFACAAAAAATAAGLHTFLKGLFIADCVAILFSHFVRQFDFFSRIFL
jgi:hypothetical protein